MLLTILGLFLLFHVEVSADLNSSFKGKERVNLLRLMEMQYERKKSDGAQLQSEQTSISHVAPTYDKNIAKYFANSELHPQGLNNSTEMLNPKAEELVPKKGHSEHAKRINLFDGVRLVRRRLAAPLIWMETTDFNDAARAMYDYIRPGEDPERSDEATENRARSSSENYPTDSNTEDHTPSPSSENKNDQEYLNEDDPMSVTSLVNSVPGSGRNSESEYVERISPKVSLRHMPTPDPQEHNIVEDDELQDFEVNKIFQEANSASSITDTEEQKTEDVEMIPVVEEISFVGSSGNKLFLLFTKYRWPLMGLVLQIAVIIWFFVPRIRKMRRKG